MQGGTTFHFVTEGIETAPEQAKVAAGSKDVVIGGGASVIQQCLHAGLLDELELHLVPQSSGQESDCSTASARRRWRWSMCERCREPASPI